MWAHAFSLRPAEVVAQELTTLVGSDEGYGFLRLDRSEYSSTRSVVQLTVGNWGGLQIIEAEQLAPLVLDAELGEWLVEKS